MKKVDIPEKISLRHKFAKFNTLWEQCIVAGLNGQQLRLFKSLGPFIWHEHQEHDILYLIFTGEVLIQFEGGKETDLSGGELLLVPKGTTHRVASKMTAEILLIVPETALNTGSTPSLLTRQVTRKI